MGRQFDVEIKTTVTIELADEVINQVDGQWRKDLYSDVKTPEDIAKYIAYNMVVNNAKLSHIDGFANLTDDKVKIISGLDDWETEIW